MNLCLPDSLLRRIHAHAESAYPSECCGILLGEVTPQQDRLVHDVEPVRNGCAEEEACDHYRIDTADYLRIDRRARTKGWEILGSYHSHPDGQAVPSAVDLACAWPWYVYLIVAVDHGQAVQSRGWRLNEPADGEPGRFEAVAIK